MTGSAHIARAKLVTIIAAAELWDRLEADLRRLGASGYTFVSVNGRGEHGSRPGSWLESGNVRIETVVTPEFASSIMDHLLRDYAAEEMTAYVHDVDAIRRR
jgi:nitrogen regulatory protein PII